MPSITRYPNGLLDLLGLQSQGDNPRLVSDIVSSIVDVGQLYLANVQVLVTGSVAAAAANFNSFATPLIVPTGEIWLLKSFSATVAAGVGVTGSFSPAVRAQGNRLMLSDYTNFNASTTAWKVAVELPIWLPAGYELGVEIQNLAGGNPVASGTAILSRLRA